MPLARHTVLVVCAVAALVAGLAIPLVVLPDNDPGLWSGLILEIQTVQRDLHRQLAAAMQAVRADGAAAGSALVILSFLYGVFHAAGPGHGKVVISTYILTQESQLRRGVLLSLVSSLCQGLTAILVVSATAGLLGLTLRQAQGGATGLETLSYALVAVLGLTLVATRARHLLRRRSVPIHGGRDAPSQLAHVHHHGHDTACSSCGHTHGPSLRDLDAPLSWRGLAGMVASIGLRPCSGAVLVLLVAFSLDLFWAGVAAVLAMSLGTAITVSLLAVLSVYARKGALRLAAGIPDRSARLAVALDLVGLLGGFVILVVGLLMLQATFAVPVHPLR